MTLLGTQATGSIRFLALKRPQAAFKRAPPVNVSPCQSGLNLHGVKLKSPDKMADTHRCRVTQLVKPELEVGSGGVFILQL